MMNNSFKIDSLSAHHAQRDGYFGQTFVAAFLLCTAVCVAASADEPPETQQKIKSPAEEATDSPSADLQVDSTEPHPFDGEWRFHSITSKMGKQMTAADVVRDDYADSIEEVVEAFKIRDRKVWAGIDWSYELTKSSGGWDIQLTGSDFEATGTVEVFGSILRLSYTQESERTVIEFWRVDPKRQELLRALTSRHEDAASLQQQGRFSELQIVNAQIQQLNRDLKRMDRVPEFSSRRAEALRAREAGDHEAADRLDAATDSWLQQAEDNVIAQKESTEALATQNISATDRATLQRRLGELRGEVERNEDACITAAAAFRNVLTTAEADPGRKNELHAELQKAVRTAFETRWQLQDVRLKLTAADLNTLQQKHHERQRLAEKIIERRVEQLKSGDELSWTQAATAEKRPNTSSPSAAKPQTDPEIEGDWKLISASEAYLLTLKTNSRLRIADGKWTLTYSGQKREMQFQANTSATPRQIDLGGMSSLQNNFSGIYKVQKNLLTITFTAAAASRPTDFSSPDTSIQVWKRVKPIPKFETPEQLLDFMTSASDDENPDFEHYMQLYTDDEATRFAGMLVASMGMMNRMMPLMMMSNAMEEDGPSPINMTVMARVSALLRDAVSANAPPQCLQAYNELMKSDMSFMGVGGPISAKITDPDVFSEKLKLAGGAVGDARSFAAQLMLIMVDMNTESDDSADDGEKPPWVVTLDGNTAVAVKESKDREGEFSTERMELIRQGDTWKISNAIDRKTLAEMAPAMTGGMVGTDSDGNEVSLGEIFGEMSGGVEPVVAELEPLTLKQALQQQKFSDMDLERWFTPTSHPFKLSPPTPRDAFPEWLPQYIEGARDLLEGAWGDREYRLLRSLDPAIHFAKDSDNWALKDIGERIEAHVREHANAKTPVAFPAADSPWSAAMLSRIARTLGKLPDEAYTAKHPAPDVRKRLTLLQTILQNKANETWIDQEQIRLSGLLLEAPVETLRLIFWAESGESLEEMKRWLFAVSKPEFYESLNDQNKRLDLKQVFAPLKITSALCAA